MVSKLSPIYITRKKCSRYIMNTEQQTRYKVSVYRRRDGAAGLARRGRWRRHGGGLPYYERRLNIGIARVNDARCNVSAAYGLALK